METIDIKTNRYIRDKFKEYYDRNIIPAPQHIYEKEFGISDVLGKKITIRHKSFKTESELNNYLRSAVPYFISYSAAYYEFPGNPSMSTKNMLGAELIFDLDADIQFMNRKALDDVKGQCLKLIDFLLIDFGFDKKSIKINFSGSKGYHIHIDTEEVQKLGKDERREIVDYVTGSGLKFLEYPFIVMNDEGIYIGPTENSKGWARRVYDGMMAFITSDEGEMRKMRKILNIDKKKAEEISRNREKNIKLLKKGRWGGLIGITPKSEGWGTLIDKIVSTNAVRMIHDTDKMVTIDITRLIRLPETLHGDTGLIAKNVRNLDEFDPTVDAIAFKEGEIKIKAVRNIPEFEIWNDRIEGIKEGETKTVPECAAVYLILKNAAKLSV